MRIGIFGGSFNPIHNGHVALGRAMLSAVLLDEVWYMVSPRNPLKVQSSDLAPEEERFQITQAALSGEPGLVASDYEFHLPRPSYTWNTLQHLSQDYPAADFVLIIGGDNWDCFDKWAHYEDILKNYEVAVYPRKGMMTEKVPKAKSHSDVKTRSDTKTSCEADIVTMTNTVWGEAKKVTFVDLPLMDVCSTQVREMIRSGNDISHLVPPAVAKKVEKTSLYG